MDMSGRYAILNNEECRTSDSGNEEDLTLVALTDNIGKTIIKIENEISTIRQTLLGGRLIGDQRTFDENKVEKVENDSIINRLGWSWAELETIRAHLMDITDKIGRGFLTKE